MRRLTSLVLLAVSAALTAAVAPATAITHGEPDTDHPGVGLLVAQGADGRPLWTCSGTVLAPTVLVTAGHCTEAPAVHVEVFLGEGHIPRGAGFDPATRDCTGVVGYPCLGETGGTPLTHPEYDPDDFLRHDLGVVILDRPVELESYPRLPEPGLLDDARPSKTFFTAVGYGLQDSYPDASSWKEAEYSWRVRLVAHPRLLKIGKGVGEDFAFEVTANADTGGTCDGDSGGPFFLGDSDVLVGVTSFGKRNEMCTGSSGVHRVDQEDDLAWLRTFLG